MASDAVGLERVSRIVGYKVTKGNFSNTTPNLPQRIAILAEANTANQGSLDDEGTAVTTAQRAGELYGFGSPIYHIMRILRPQSGGGIGGIPTVVYPQFEASGATAKELEIEVTGTATANGTHTLIISGRTGLDGEFYDVNINKDDTADVIHGKIEDAVNAVLGCPVTATSTDYETTLTTKWKGLTANDTTVTVDTGDDALGLTYAVTTTAAGSGTPSVQNALNQFQNDWVTLVINGYGTDSNTMDLLEDFNGIADPNSPTGRYAGIIFKPFVALTGATECDISGSVFLAAAITDARKTEMTIAICPAPNSDGYHFEAAANVALLQGRVGQDNPQNGTLGRSYSDMPIPRDTAVGIGDMASYDTRDQYVKMGCSTVDIVAGKYVIQEIVTTYHPDGELPPQFRYVRNLILDWNIRFGYWLLEQQYVVDHVIVEDDDTVTATNTIKPKQWVGVLGQYAESLTKRALIAEPAFMQESIEVNISTTNPDRLETFFRYKRTGIARISSTTAEAGFNFGEA